MTIQTVTGVEAVKAALVLPTLTGHDGQVYTAARVPRLVDGLDFLQAAGSAPDLQTLIQQVAGARALLLGMGFPAAVVNDLSPREAVERALDFFLDDLGMKLGTPRSATTPSPS